MDYNFINIIIIIIMKIYQYFILMIFHFKHGLSPKKKIVTSLYLNIKI
jgi:hypothetical protein